MEPRDTVGWNCVWPFKHRSQDATFSRLEQGKENLLLLPTWELHVLWLTKSICLANVHSCAYIHTVSCDIVYGLSTFIIILGFLFKFCLLAEVQGGEIALWKQGKDLIRCVGKQRKQFTLWENRQVNLSAQTSILSSWLLSRQSDVTAKKIIWNGISFFFPHSFLVFLLWIFILNGESKQDLGKLKQGGLLSDLGTIFQLKGSNVRSGLCYRLLCDLGWVTK